MKKKQNRESGLVIVEASIVFPVMFFVILFLLFLGNAYYLKSTVEQYATEAALNAAAYCADPMLQSVEGSGSVTTDVDAIEIKPYRYIFVSGMDDVTKPMELDLKKKLEGMGTGFFPGMKPEGISRTSLTFNWGLFCSSVTASVDCEVPMGIRLLGMDEVIRMPVSTRITAPVSDTPEFIRIVDTVGDYLNESGVTEKINEVVSKVKDWFN